jgi:prepilin-type N-terminal cleavage/methylation domain-containing protein
MNCRGMVKGFTLLEVLIAVVIAALSLTGIFALSTLCRNQIWAAREMSRAVSAVEYEMETLRAVPWSNITARGSSYTISTNSNPILANLAGGAGTVQLIPISGNTNAITATVSLAWRDRNGSLRTNSTAATIISKNGFLR